MYIPPHLTPKRLALLDDLDPDFTARVLDVLRRCAKHGARLVPYCGARAPATQARLWRQSRTLAQIESTAADLNRRGAAQIAGLLLSVGAQQGRWATNALPGQSAHQYGLALDCFLMDDQGGANWDPDAEGYKIYAVEAESIDLIAGIHFNDPVHIEWRERPYDPISWPSIQAALEERRLI